MKLKLRTTLPALVLLPLCLGCSRTGQGAMLGGLLGGTAGLATGAAVGSPVAGTLIGGGLGAVGGAVVGHALEGGGSYHCHHHCD